MITNKSEIITLADVKDNQFFIDIYGHLCQKVGGNHYTTIADKFGVPFATCGNASKETIIVKKVLDIVTRIEFE